MRTVPATGRIVVMTQDRILPLVLVGLLLLVYGCGSSNSSSSGSSSTQSATPSSQQASATSTVCQARDDIGKQVSSLAALTATTVSKAAVNSSLAAIGNDLTTIKDAQPELSGQRKSQVQAANQAFAAQLRATAASVATNLSANGAKDQATTALHELSDAYKTSLAKIDCSS
jgi:hypothetical protein